MSVLVDQDERAVDRLSFYMLKEAYSALASLLCRLDEDKARAMFQAIEQQIEQALQRIHEQRSEGENSTAIAAAIAETLVQVLDDAHRTSEGETSEPNASPAAVDERGRSETGAVGPSLELSASVA